MDCSRAQITRALSLMLLALVVPLAAQEYRGRLLGHVSDPSGAAVPEANVALTNTATNVSSVSRTNSEGNFVVILEPGTYNAIVEANGFRKKTVLGLVVRAGDQMSLDFPLEVGAATESVTVSGQTPQLETATASVSQVIDRRFIDMLFVSNRNPLNLVSLTPGVVGAAGSSLMANQAADAQQNQFTINGSGVRQGGNEVVIDGVSVTLPRQAGAVSASPSGDTVEELRVQTTMFDAAYGHTTGGVVTYATRGGTNEIHGSFEGFYRNKAFNANTWLNNKNGLPRGDVNRKFFSGTIGGPVYLPKIYDGRNRTFFFFSAQEERNNVGITYERRTMTELERAGDFSQTLNSQGAALQIYDPWSTVVSGGVATRLPFSGARIPSSRFDPVGAKLASLYPDPTTTAQPRLGLNNWAATTLVAQPNSNYSLRLDENVSSHYRLFGRVSWMKYNSGPPSDLPRGFQLYEGELREFLNVTLNNDFSFSPTLLASVRLSFNRLATDTLTSAAMQDPAELGLPEIILANAEARAWPQTVVSDAMGLGGRIKFRANDSWAIVPNITKLWRSHALRFGGDVRLVNWNSRELGYGMTGSYTFNNAFTRSDPFTPASGNVSGSGMASLLLGIPASGSFGVSSPYSLRQYYYSGYFQDDWKVSSKLTLNIGLRWETETPYTERYNRTLYGFDYNATSPVPVPGLNLKGGLLYAGKNGAPRAQGNQDLNNFGPRFGFAYQVARNTVIRGGYALFYASNSALVDQSLAIAPTFNRNASYVASLDSGATPYTTLSNPFPGGIPPAQGSSLGLASRLGDSITFVDPHRVAPYTQQFQFGLQHQLPGAIRLQANFIRTLSLKLPENFNLNEKPDRYLALGSAENTLVPNPFYGIYPTSAPLGTSATIPQRQFWSAFPQFSGITVYGSPTGIASYNALQLDLDKRLSHGLTLMANLTVSKQLQNNVTSLVNQRNYDSISWMDRSKIANVAAVYDLPFGKGRSFGRNARGVTSFLISNWTVSSRLYLASGTPLSFSDSNGRPIRIRNAAKSGPVNERLGDRVDPVTKQVLNPYFDVTAFQSLPNQYTVSPEPPYFGELRGPGTTNLDLSLIKRFRILERLNADVRADASNFTNTPVFAAPGTDLANRSTFGVITNASSNRTIQLAFRMVF
ncbi:MAG TPA: TonB-dependent receptor [Bryobacteraceae bacterium]|nr:TonB-dependent receptor [Bryobacteraceae bacterium]